MRDLEKESISKTMNDFQNDFQPPNQLYLHELRNAGHHISIRPRQPPASAGSRCYAMYTFAISCFLPRR